MKSVGCEELDGKNAKRTISRFFVSNSKADRFLFIEDTSAIGRFRGYLQSFADEENKHLEWLKKKKEQCFRNGMAFVVSSDMQIPPEYKSPGSMLILNPATKHLPEPKNIEEEYQRYYIILASIHDNTLPEVERIDNGILPEQTAYLIWNLLGEFYDSEYKRVFVEQAFERVKAETPPETEQDATPDKRQGIIVWIKRHPHSYGLTGSFILLISAVVVGWFNEQWRPWCWGTASLAFLVLILSLLGGRSR